MSADSRPEQVGIGAAEQRSRPARIRRRPADLAMFAVGAVVLVLCALPVHAHSISALEADAFRLVNHLPDVPFAIVWVPMQLGNFLVVPAAVLAALLARKWRLAAALATAGAGVYALAKVVKHYVLRGRPDTLLDDVTIRGAAAHGLGFVSGHIAVVTALTLVAWPWLPRWARWAAGAAVVAVFLTRMYVGAHLPLDMIGGAALGLGVAGAVRWLFGTPVGDAEPRAAAPAPGPDAGGA